METPRENKKLLRQPPPPKESIEQGKRANGAPVAERRPGKYNGGRKYQSRTTSGPSTNSLIVVPPWLRLRSRVQTGRTLQWHVASKTEKDELRLSTIRHDKISMKLSHYVIAIFYRSLSSDKNRNIANFNPI